MGACGAAGACSELSCGDAAVLGRDRQADSGIRGTKQGCSPVCQPCGIPGIWRALCVGISCRTAAYF